MYIGSGIWTDLRRRAPWYKQDWKDGFAYGFRLLGPATYVFFLSAVPVLAFGEQMQRETDGILTAVQTLAATGVCGVVQAIFGGQPLLITDVSEPITITYGYMYTFARNKQGLGRENFLPWAGWSCVWAGSMLLFVAALNGCNYITRFTRFSGELFGCLVAILFVQQFVQGVVGEFRQQDVAGEIYSPLSRTHDWLLINGFWSLFLAFGLLYCAWTLHHARSWRIGPIWMRTFLADYGVVSMVGVWTGISYALKGHPPGVVRRLALPNTWDHYGFWSTSAHMGQLEGKWIAGALIPGLIIAILFYFDHSVSAQLAQMPEFNVRRPTAYHYDLALLGVTTIICGILGVPPPQGSLPQAPLHSRSLATMRSTAIHSRLTRVARKAAREGRLGRAAVLQAMIADCEAQGDGEVVQNLQQLLAQSGKRECKPECYMDSLQNGTREGAQNGVHAEGDVPHQGKGAVDHEELQGIFREAVPFRVAEQRMSNLIQSLLVVACCAITPVLKFIPEAVLWGYFAYMAIASLPGNQFFERITLLVTDPAQRSRVARDMKHTYWPAVPMKWVAAITVFQAAYLGMVYGITWAWIVGVIFPVPILLLVPIRQFLMPRIFPKQFLDLVDNPKEDNVQNLGEGAAPEPPRAQADTSPDRSSDAKGNAAELGTAGREDEARTEY